MHLVNSLFNDIEYIEKILLRQTLLLACLLFSLSQTVGRWLDFAYIESITNAFSQ